LLLKHPDKSLWKISELTQLVVSVNEYLATSRLEARMIRIRFDAGEVKDVYGLDFKMDKPENPELLIDFDPCKTPEDIVVTLEERLKNHF